MAALSSRLHARLVEKYRRATADKILSAFTVNTFARV